MSRKGVNLVEIMIVATIVILIAVVVMPSFLKGKY